MPASIYPSIDEPEEARCNDHLYSQRGKEIFQGDGGVPPRPPEDRKQDHLAKDGCSGQGVCGACTVEINGKARMACRTKMKNLEGAEIVTAEGLPERFRTSHQQEFCRKRCSAVRILLPGYGDEGKGAL